MFGRKQKFLEHSQQCRQSAQELTQEAVNNLARAAFHGGKSMFIDGGISEVVNGFQGFKNLGKGVYKAKQAYDYHQMANTLEEKAKNTKWWHF
ncbi:hypothetical protein [Nostoc sp. TCL26-01]|uniref:hypothetical protein n=1 Tax=Nostoc sp. TCL26-01 TaxID=2576904 RepID=UPI0015C19B8F|nr:hypothetical protein [Nostoc sp. TCL26-01]QLE59823.1 hypothetical protein FD725_30795 [Nostoc sp. TCL26-01]